MLEWKRFATKTPFSFVEERGFLREGRIPGNRKKKDAE